MWGKFTKSYRKCKKTIEFSWENTEKLNRLKNTPIESSAFPYTIQKFIKEFLEVLLNFTQINLYLLGVHDTRNVIVTNL